LIYRKILSLLIAILLNGYGYNCFSTNYYVKSEYPVRDSTFPCNQGYCEYEIIHFWVEENYGGEFDLNYNGIKRTDTTYNWVVDGIISGNDTSHYSIQGKNEIFLNIGEYSWSSCSSGGIFGLVYIIAPPNDNRLGNGAPFVVYRCPPVANFINSLNSNIICQDACVSFIDSSLYRPLTWHWQIFKDSENGILVKEDTVQNMNMCFTDTGNFVIKLYVSNDVGHDSIANIVRVISAPIRISDSMQEISIVDKTEIELIACSIGEHYEWYPKENLSCNNCNIATATISSDKKYYCVVSNSNGCADTCFYKITAPFDIFIPNAFTPNGDGINDIFRIRGVNIEIEKVQVYNRFGNLIYSGRLENSWDGRYNNELVEDGIYAYQLTYLNKKSNLRTSKSGVVAVIR